MTENLPGIGISQVRDVVRLDLSKMMFFGQGVQDLEKVWQRVCQRAVEIEYRQRILHETVSMRQGVGRKTPEIRSAIEGAWLVFVASSISWAMILSGV